MTKNRPRIVTIASSGPNRSILSGPTLDSPGTTKPDSSQEKPDSFELSFRPKFDSPGGGSAASSQPSNAGPQPAPRAFQESTGASAKRSFDDQCLSIKDALEKKEDVECPIPEPGSDDWLQLHLYLHQEWKGRGISDAHITEMLKNAHNAQQKT
jgi:hypothetical protein